MMIYLGKKFVIRSYKKVKHKIIRGKKKAITNNDLYKLVLLNTTQQNKQTEERYMYVVTLFGIFIVLVGVYLYQSS